MAETVYVSGLKELRAQLRQIADAVGEKAAAKPVSGALSKAARMVQKQAVSILEAKGHVKTGTLKNNVIVYKRKTASGSIAYGVSVRSKAKKFKDTSRNRSVGKVGGKYRDYGPLFYGQFLEFGTSHQGASPFLGPAFDAKQEQLPVIVRDDLDDRLAKLLTS